MKDGGIREEKRREEREGMIRGREGTTYEMKKSLYL